MTSAHIRESVDVKALRGGMKVVLYQCLFCGGLDKSSELHVHAGPGEYGEHWASPSHKSPKRRVFLAVDRSERV